LKVKTSGAFCRYRSNFVRKHNDDSIAALFVCKIVLQIILEGNGACIANKHGKAAAKREAGENGA
jgi:hypothetical protein